MFDDEKVDPAKGMLSEFAKLIQEGKKAKAEAEAKKKETFFEKYQIEDTNLNPFSFISELAKLKKEAEVPQEEIIETPEEPVVVEEVKKPTASELLAELASLISQGKKANKEVFEEQEEHLEPFVAEMVQDIVELQKEEIKEEIIVEPKPVDLISQTVESITKVAEQNKVNEVTNLFSTPEPDKTAPNFKAIQTKLKSLEQWVSKISTAGPGSGSYWLNDLGDTDKVSLQNATDGQVLTFSADIGKWTAADATGGGGGTVDTVARTIANRASANTIVTQGVDDTQNTRIGSVETSIINQNNSITNLQNVNITQNNNITTVTGLAQAAFDKANTFVDTYTDQYARDRANSGISLAQSAYNYANTITIPAIIDQTARNTANSASSNTIYTQGVDATQNTNITNATTLAQAAYNQANTVTVGNDIIQVPGQTVNSRFYFTANNGLWTNHSGNLHQSSINHTGGNLYYGVGSPLDQKFTELDAAQQELNIEFWCETNITFAPYYVKVTIPYAASAPGDVWWEIGGSGQVYINSLPDIPAGTTYYPISIAIVESHASDGSISIASYGANNFGWKFDSNTGSLLFPDGTTQTTAYTGGVSGSTLDQYARDTANSAVTSTIYLQGVNDGQNAFVSSLNTYTYSAYAVANNALNNSILVQNKLTYGANANIALLQGAMTSANANIVSLFSLTSALSSNVAYNQAIDSSQNTSISIIQGVDLTQNTNITNADTKAQGAFNKANNALANTSGVVTAGDITISGNTYTNKQIISTYNGTNGGATLMMSGTGTQGGAGYFDFIKANNTTNGTSAMSFRLDNTGTLQLINSSYTSQAFAVTQTGVVFVGSGAASSTNNDATTNYINFNNQNSVIYDDGNFHIHSRGSGQSMWINTNGGDLKLLTQSTVNGGSVGNSVIMGGSQSATASGFLNVLGSKNMSYSGYGYLSSGGAGTVGGNSGSVGVGIYTPYRIYSGEVDSTSDERLKDIQGTIPLDTALQFVNGISGIHYTWKQGFGDDGLKAGFGAQSVHKAGFAHMVSGIPNEKVEGKTDEDGWVHPDKEQLNISYNEAIPYHHEVIKHLIQKVEELQNEINILKQEKS